MTRQHFQNELTRLRADVLEMSDAVRTQLENALAALQEGDDELARRIVEADDAINETYLQLEGRCIDLIALQQPVAIDLRFISASFKIITDLERIGDLAVNLGQYSLAAEPGVLPAVDLRSIGEDASRMVADAMTAYETENPELCRKIAARDDDLDVLCQRASERITRDLLETEAIGATAWDVERLLEDVSRLLLTIRDLERVGDHAVNVAARTLYMVETDPELLY